MQLDQALCNGLFGLAHEAVGSRLLLSSRLLLRHARLYHVQPQREERERERAGGERERERRRGSEKE